MHAGAYAEVNGPHDRYGVVWNSKSQDDGSYLNLIRGAQPRDGKTPLACF